MPPLLSIALSPLQGYYLLGKTLRPQAVENLGETNSSQVVINSEISNSWKHVYILGEGLAGKTCDW